MKKIDDFFYIVISDDQMTAEVHCKQAYSNQTPELNVAIIIQFLKHHKVIYGVDKAAIERILTNPPSNQFPIIIARGKKSIPGIDGKIVFKQDYHKTDIERDENWSFRDVMQIPTVKKGEKLANKIPPTQSEEGKNVHGKIFKERSGKPTLLRAGKGVIFKEEDQSFYAEIEGQVSITDHIIQVHSVFEVDGTLSLEVGNLDFVGSIIINGDVPTGYTVKAAGDIKVHGIVEAATIIAGGSIYITEGLSGLKKGYLKAGENIHIGYINQGTAIAGQSIHVENSVTHSNCSAEERVFCQRGNIIGGSISAGESIEAGDLGNRLSTNTTINLGLDKRKDDEQKKLTTKRKELTETLQKIKTIGDMLADRSKQQDAKMRVTILRQKHSYQQISEKIKEIDLKLHKINTYLGNTDMAKVVVRKKLYPNVTIAFGKYERKINKKRENVQLTLKHNDIIIREVKE